MQRKNGQNGNNFCFRNNSQVNAKSIGWLTASVAARRAQEVLTLAKPYGYVGYQLEARLIAAKALAKSGKLQKAQTEAASLAKDAHARGYLRIEQEATNILHPQYVQIS